MSLIAAKSIIEKARKKLFNDEWYKYPKRAESAAYFLLKKGLEPEDIEDVICAIFEDAKNQYGD